MENKRNTVPMSTVTRDLNEFREKTGNLYETVVIMSKRANQIAQNMKKDLEEKLQDFSSYSDNLEEVNENEEQIELSRHYEKLPKPTLIAAKELQNDEIYFRNPNKRTEEEVANDDF